MPVVTVKTTRAGAPGTGAVRNLPLTDWPERLSTCNSYAVAGFKPLMGKCAVKSRVGSTAFHAVICHEAAPAVL